MSFVLLAYFSLPKTEIEKKRGAGTGREGEREVRKPLFRQQVIGSRQQEQFSVEVFDF